MRVGNTNLALLYSDSNGKMERIANITVSVDAVKTTAYGYDKHQVSDLVPTVVGDIPFWKNPELYKRVLIQTHGTAGLPFDQGTVYFRWSTADIKPTKPVSGVVTKLPPQ